MLVTNWNYQPGSFGILRWGRRNAYEAYRPLYIEWFNCRDSFHYVFQKKNHLLDFYYVGDYKRISRFFKDVEKRLKLFTVSKFYKTNVRRVCLIAPSFFWRKSIRLSLFTLLLNVARDYKGDLEECLNRNELSQECLTSIHHFLEGNVVYRGKLSEWKTQFDDLQMREKCYVMDELLKPTFFARIKNGIGKII